MCPCNDHYQSTASTGHCILEPTHESNTPNDTDIGSLPSSRGCLIFLEHVVRPVSSSYVAFGSFAELFISEDDNNMASFEHTIFEGRNHSQQRSVEDVAVIVDAGCIYV